MPESACPSPSGSKNIQVERHGFGSIPGQSRLFIDFLKGAPALSEYYPNAVNSHDDLAGFAEEVLKNYSTDRTAICDILLQQNQRFGCGQATIENIELLRQSDCVAILTGQQAGLFTGPLYTIYKAISTVRSANALRKKAINVVPVFWIATEDHDLAEVSNASSVSADGRLRETMLIEREADAGKPVGAIDLDNSIERAVDDLFRTLPATEFSEELRETISNAYTAGETFGTSFGRLITNLLRRFGLIVFDPMDSAAKQLSVPIVIAAVERSDEIVKAIIDRSKELVSAGYHAQVLVENDHCPVFWIDDTGVRRSLKRTGDNKFRASGTRTEFTAVQLRAIAETEPRSLSPGVMLRPVVQDFLFPTICYFGGAAEIAYFAQNSQAYRVLDRPVTPILPRQSFTIVEAKHKRTLERYGLEFDDLFHGLDRLRSRIVENVIDPETPRVFAEVGERINAELDGLDQQLSKIDATLSEALANRRRKINHHISAMRAKFHRASLEKSETINRRMGSMFDSLLPNNGMQERTLNFSTFANRYGDLFFDMIYDAVDLDNADHKVIYL